MENPQTISQVSETSAQQMEEPLKVMKLRLANRHNYKAGYAEAVAVKDARIKELKKSGLGQEDAVRRAWEELDAAMSGVDLPALEIKPAPPLVQVDGASETDFVSAARWVLDHLVVQVDLEQAPSPGAWAMLLWARDSQSDFFKQVLPRAIDIEAKRAAAIVPITEDEDEADIGDLLA